MKQLLQKRFDRQTLSREEATQALLLIGNGEVNPTHIASFLTTYILQPVTVEELEGFRDAMLQLAVPLDLSAFDPMDLCGTGGDGKDTFNISTTASFVVAGTGQRVAKHGNHGVSSAVGSSTVLEHLGIKFTNDADYLQRKIETTNICYLHAPLFHPAMRHVAPIRKDLGFKTFFNMLGPLLNPAKVQKQATGTYNLEVANLFAQLFRKSNGSFAVVHALDGYDEISLTGNIKVYDRHNDHIISPKDFGFRNVSAEALYGGGTLQESADILINILQNEGTEAQTQVVLANAAMALYAADNTISLPDAVATATESLESGRAYQCLKKLTE
jgi:anthranilate phosphoribosyltransferase